MPSRWAGLSRPLGRNPFSPCKPGGPGPRSSAAASPPSTPVATSPVGQPGPCPRCASGAAPSLGQGLPCTPPPAAGPRAPPTREWPRASSLRPGKAWWEWSPPGLLSPSSGFPASPLPRPPSLLTRAPAEAGSAQRAAPDWGRGWSRLGAAPVMEPRGHSRGCGVKTPPSGLLQLAGPASGGAQHTGSRCFHPSVSRARRWQVPGWATGEQGAMPDRPQPVGQSRRPRPGAEGEPCVPQGPLTWPAGRAHRQRPKGRGRREEAQRPPRTNPLSRWRRESCLP